jgi:hypothetical protein
MFRTDSPAFMFGCSKRNGLQQNGAANGSKHVDFEVKELAGSARNE